MTSDRPSGILFFSCPPYFCPYNQHICSYLNSSSVSLSYFLLAVPKRECLGKHSCTSSSFPIAIIPNGTPSLFAKRDYLYSQRFACQKLPIKLLIIICMWLNFSILFFCFFEWFLLFSPKGLVTGWDSTLGSFGYSPVLLHFAFMNLRSGYYYYDYVVIGVLGPLWLYWNSLLNRPGFVLWS